MAQRPRIHRALYQVAISVVLLCGQTVLAKEAWEHNWNEVRSTHFIVASTLSNKQTTALVEALENFRVAVAAITNISMAAERVPTRIYILPSPENDFRLSGALKGYMLTRMRGNYAVMVPTGSSTADVLKHEYIHFLVHNHSAQEYPTWFDEGFAELLATVRVKGAILEYGKASPKRMSWLVNGDWMPFARLLSVRDTGQLRPDEKGMFYAQAWFLLHYLNIGGGSANFLQQSHEYLRLVELGEDSPAAFAEAFGIDPQQLEARLRKYAQRMTYHRGKLLVPLPPVATTGRAIPRAEIAAQLGTLSAQTGGAEAATKYFDAALADDPNNAQALVGLANTLERTDRQEQARNYYERAIALEPSNANHYLDFAEHLLMLASAEQSPERRRAQVLNARRQFLRSYELDPSNPETLAMNGSSYLFPGEADAGKAVASLELAHRLLPAHPEIRLQLAKAYIAAGRTADARRQLTQLLAWSHTAFVEELQSLLSSLADVPTGDAAIHADDASTTELTPANRQSREPQP